MFALSSSGGRYRLTADKPGRVWKQRRCKQASRVHHSPRLVLLGASGGGVEDEHRIRGLYFVVRGVGADQVSVLEPQSAGGGDLDSFATHARKWAGVDLNAVAGRLLGRHFTRIHKFLGPVGWVILALLVVALAFWLIRRKKRSTKARG